MSIEYPETNEWDVLLIQFLQYEGIIPIKKLRAIIRIAFYNFNRKLGMAKQIQEKLQMLVALGRVEQQNEINQTIRTNIFSGDKQTLFSQWLQRRRENKTDINTHTEV